MSDPLDTDALRAAGERADYYQVDDEFHGSDDPRAGTSDCDCGHSSFRHHGSDRSGRGYLVYSLASEFTGCKDCGWCDYYKPRRIT